MNLCSDAGVPITDLVLIAFVVVFLGWLGHLWVKACNGRRHEKH